MRHAALSVLLFGCATTSKESAASKTEPTRPERRLSFQQGGVALPDDPIWQRGSGMDPMDLQSLGHRAGAAQLVEIAEQGGRTGAVALEALALAPDARAERARTCELLADVRESERGSVLRVVLGVVQGAPQLHEALAPGADETCVAQLRAVLGDPELDPAHRDLAQAALFSLSGPLAEPAPAPSNRQ